MAFEKNIEKELKLPLFVTFVILLLEIAGAFITNSLALLSDAGHVFMDFFALLLTFFALKISIRPANHRVTFGFHRVEIFASLINVFTLMIVSALIFYHAYLRIFEPQHVNSILMLPIAIIGLIGNAWVVTRLKKYNDINIRSAYLHVFGDLISSFAVVFAGILIFLTGNFFIDSVLSFIIGGIILLGTFRLLHETALVLMEGSPMHIDLKKLESDIKKIKGIKGIHDIHVWSICSNIHMLSAHVLIRNASLNSQIKFLDEINNAIEKKYGIAHATIQFECANCGRINVH